MEEHGTSNSDRLSVLVRLGGQIPILGDLRDLAGPKLTLPRYTFTSVMAGSLGIGLWGYIIIEAAQAF